MIKSHFSIFLLALLLTACASNIQSKLQYWNQELEIKIPKGTNKDGVKHFLTNSKLEFSYAQDNKTFYAMDKMIQSDLFLYSAVILIRNQLDENDKVLNFVIKKEYSGL